MTGMLDEGARSALIEELAEAAEAMVARSCLDMLPLWLMATERERREVLGGNDELPADVPEKLAGKSKSTKSKYRALAAWRHAVLWLDLLAAPAVAHADDTLDPDFVDAAACVYFTPFPANTPPYAWSRATAQAPGVDAYANASQCRDWAKEGCFALWNAIRCRYRDWPRQPDRALAARGELLRAAARDSVGDVLKLDNFDTPERAR